MRQSRSEFLVGGFPYLSGLVESDEAEDDTTKDATDEAGAERSDDPTESSSISILKELEEELAGEQVKSWTCPASARADVLSRAPLRMKKL